ncbi:hypothetical protein DINM_001985 [Dirofilaria immitis]|nr:hypothetical protein [Dirofilaria immitis]
MDGHSYYGGGGCPSWMRIGNALSGVSSTTTSQQQQRFYYSMSFNNATKNKTTKINDGSIGYQDYQNHYPHQQQQQQQQYSGTNRNSANYYSCAGFLAKQQLQQSTVSTGGKRGRTDCTFPKKNRFCYGIDAAYLPPNKKPRNYSTTGKTAAMILNELYPEFKDQCSYKTLACELALKELRPDIMLDISVSESEAKKVVNFDYSAPQAEWIRGYTFYLGIFSIICVPIFPFQWLHVRVMFQDKEHTSNEKFTPQFTFSELSTVDTDGKAQKNSRKVYSHEGYGKSPIKNAVIRQALVDVFDVPQEELKMVERRTMNLKPGKPMQAFAFLKLLCGGNICLEVLIQALNFYDRTMQVDVDTVDGKPVQGNSRFICRITLDNNKTIIGPPQDNKQKAKDSACEKVLLEELDLTMPSEDVRVKRATAILSPPYALHQLMLKQNRKKNPDIVYSEPLDISEAPNKPPLFKCILTVNGTDKFEGTGQSKRLLKFDLCAENALEMISMKNQKRRRCAFCTDICTFVRQEYEGICHQQACPITTHISAFVLIAPNGEKQMVAIGAGRSAVIDGQVLTSAQGNVLIHMQNTVLARRAFLLFLHNQIRNHNAENSVVERAPTSDKFRLKTGYQVVLYASFPPNLRSSGEIQKLSCYMGGARLEDPPKAYKLSMISEHPGLQGALLSHLLEPIFMTHLCVGAPSNDKAIMQAVLLRFGDMRKGELTVKSSPTGVVPHGEMYHNWVSGIGTIERLDPFTGRTVTGSPSRLCKSELYESWARVMASVKADGCKPVWSCSEAKQSEGVYQQALRTFHLQLHAKGLGMWQRKDSQVLNLATIMKGNSCNGDNNNDMPSVLLMTMLLFIK